MTTRREQVRDAIARHRKRRRRGLFIVTKAQLDQLEERGYLNPGDRGTRVDEGEAIASFLTDSLAKNSLPSKASFSHGQRQQRPGRLLLFVAAPATLCLYGRATILHARECAVRSCASCPWRLRIIRGRICRTLRIKNLAMSQNRCL